MSDRELFYEARDRRTRSYGIDAGPLTKPVGIVVGDEAGGTRAGQVVTLVLINLLSRIHRRVRLVATDRSLLARSLVPAQSLLDACLKTAAEINPYLELEVLTSGTSHIDPVPSLGIGEIQGSDCVSFLSAKGMIGILSATAEPLAESPSTYLGGALAACMGASELLRAVHGLKPRERRASLWGFDEGLDADPGPEVELGALDVGNVAVIGAGAVASGLAYWLREVGVKGHWIFVDGDHVQLHNTNRSLGLLAADAGWFGGSPGGTPRKKSPTTAALINADSYPGWYHEWLVSEPSARPDLVLPLANAMDVRHAVGQRGESIVLHSTPSPNWTSELHRHTPDRDGCIDCRFPPGGPIVFECSTGSIPLDNEREDSMPDQEDAALPFLSAGAGLLLAAGLIQLQYGRLAGFRPNHWRLLFGDGHGIWTRSTWLCNEGCRQRLPASVRTNVNRGKRWAALS